MVDRLTIGQPILIKIKMKKYFVVIVCLLTFFKTHAQNVISVDTISFSQNPITNTLLFSDSLVSSFCISIIDQVPKHKHMYHAEHVLVLEGAGTMLLGDKELNIKKNDLIYIPKNTFHSVKVTSNIPLKVLSFQAPYFDGKDRVFPVKEAQGAY